MTLRDQDNRDAPVRAADAILEAFERYGVEFGEITRRARSRFESRDWVGGRSDALERLDLYSRAIAEIVGEIGRILGDRLRDRAAWRSMKAAFLGQIAGRDDAPFARTFFNSVTRKVFTTVGVDREIEFVLSDAGPTPEVSPDGRAVHRRFEPDRRTARTIREILESLRFRSVGYEDLDRDARHIAREIDLHLWPLIGPGDGFHIDVIPSLFHRNKAAYVVGRIVTPERILPLVIPLLHGEGGIYADAVLLHEAEVSVVFSFTRSYFHVETDRPLALIEFLRTILPEKPLAEIHTAIGYSKHGKTEFYRDLEAHLHGLEAQFVIAPGERGKVMIVLALPGFDYVFKLIKDRADPPKTITRPEVMEKYRLVNRHDRVGRMVDTQEFEHLRFRRERFPEEILEELLRVAGETVQVRGTYVDIAHLYVERRVTPLPIYLGREKDPEAIRRVIRDLGHCIRDQAAAGIFVGDLRLPNFGVTRHGRVVSFDYDEVDLLENLNFRVKPPPRDEFEEMMPGVEWIVAGPNDVFMDEIERFLGIPARGLREVFREAHADLFTLDFWRRMQEIQRQRRIIDTIPYDRGRRFRREERRRAGDYV
jgi:isocitrate dehydrogenase kinase/phosphatase